MSGPIAFDRPMWQCKACRLSHARVDRALGVAPRGKWTLGVERKAAYVAASVPFEESSSALRELAGLEISSSEIDRIAQEHGECLDARQRENEGRWLEPMDRFGEMPEPDFSSEKLVVQADATSVLTVSGEEHKNVYCGTVFALDARGHSGDRPFISERLYAASAESMEDFSERLKATCWRGGMRRSETAFIGDGARCLWNWAENNLPVGTVFIQDFWHVCERLSGLAQTMCPDSWQETFKRWRQVLRAGGVDEILEELRRQHSQRRGGVREALRQEIAYLESGRHRMAYGRYEADGWPIGSGAVEGTCKHLVKHRFNVTGARWRRSNIHKPLALRLSIFNKEWDAYWQSLRAA